MHKAPWFYRQRASVFGMLYGGAFFVGYLIAGIVAGSTKSGPPIPSYIAFGRPVVWGVLAFVFVAAGYGMRVWASSYLAGSVVWTQDVTLSELRVSGPYRFTRNPLYLGNLLQAIGVGLCAPWEVLVVLVGGMLVFQYGLIVVEERFLAAENGEAYERYRARVARLIPLPWKVAPRGDQHGSLRDGLRSELWLALPVPAVAIWLAVTWPR